METWDFIHVSRDVRNGASPNINIIFPYPTIAHCQRDAVTKHVFHAYTIDQYVARACIGPLRAIN